MNLTIKNMDEKSARKIISWRYEKPYDFYNNEVTKDEIKERLYDSYKDIADDNGDVFVFLCSGEQLK